MINDERPSQWLKQRNVALVVSSIRMLNTFVTILLLYFWVNWKNYNWDFTYLALSINLLFNFVMFILKYRYCDSGKHRLQYATMETIGFGLILIAIYFAGGQQSEIWPLFYVNLALVTIELGWEAGFMALALLLAGYVVQSLLGENYGMEAFQLVYSLMLVGTLSIYLKAESINRNLLFHDNKRLADLASRDSLTHLINHRTFQKSLQESLLEAEVKEKPLSLLMIDVDFFKRYNDVYGHPQGDKVLIQIANIIQKSVRQQDIVARYGGEEFAVILPGLPALKGIEIAERVRAAVDKFAFECCSEQSTGVITISVGLASFPVHADSAASLVKKADEALYQAKAKGRNQVCLSSGINCENLVKMDSGGCMVDTVNALLSLVSAKDKYTFEHSRRVAQLAVALAEAMQLNQKQVELISVGAFLHDIGKVEIDSDILNKPGKLDMTEEQRIRAHVEIGAKVIHPICSMQEVTSMILYHHERYDGRGYPQGLKGEKIPLGARIIAVADAYDAMTTKRVYREGMDTSNVLAELQSTAGTQFDPNVIANLVQLKA